MPLLCDAPPPRPERLKITSVAQLFGDYEALFLREPIIQSPCGHPITFMGRHFFHLAGFDRKYRIERQLNYILRTSDGMGKYKLLYAGARARNLPTALMTFKYPDEIWEDNPKSRARWVYLKEYDFKQDSFYVSLVNPWRGLIIPFTSFPCKRSDLNRWRRGQMLSFPKATAAIRRWLP